MIEITTEDLRKALEEKREQNEKKSWLTKEQMIMIYQFKYPQNGHPELQWDQIAEVLFHLTGIKRSEDSIGKYIRRHQSDIEEWLKEESQ